MKPSDRAARRRAVVREAYLTGAARRVLLELKASTVRAAIEIGKELGYLGRVHTAEGRPAYRLARTAR